MWERWVIRGQVQGVGFRYFVFTLAHQYSISRGYVANLPDGSVEIIIEAQEPRKDKFLQAVQKGKGGSLIRVESITKEPSQLASFESPDDAFAVY